MIPNIITQSSIRIVVSIPKYKYSYIYSYQIISLNVSIHKYIYKYNSMYPYFIIVRLQNINDSEKH